jgi:hypothetical protein
MIFSFTRNLTLRITLAILLPILILGGIIYFFVSTTLSDFAQNQIQTDMISESRRIYNICNTNSIICSCHVWLTTLALLS